MADTRQHDGIGGTREADGGSGAAKRHLRRGARTGDGTLADGGSHVDAAAQRGREAHGAAQSRRAADAGGRHAAQRVASGTRHEGVVSDVTSGSQPSGMRHDDATRADGRGRRAWRDDAQAGGQRVVPQVADRQRQWSASGSTMPAHGGAGSRVSRAGSRASRGAMGDVVQFPSGASAGDGSRASSAGGSQGASGGMPRGDAGGGARTDGGAGGGVQSDGAFTEEERRLYDEAHAPLGDRVRRALAESWVPVACVVVVCVAVLLRFLMAFSSAVLTVLAVGVGVVLMGSIVYVTYEEQRRANALADEAEALYAAKCEIEDRAAERKGDGGDGTAIGRG